MIQLKKFKHTIFNLICISIFIIIFIFVALSKGNELKEVVGGKILLTYSLIIFIYLTIGLIFDFIINLLIKKNYMTIKLILQIIFFVIILVFTLYMVFIVIVLSVSKSL